MKLAGSPVFTRKGERYRKASAEQREVLHSAYALGGVPGLTKIADEMKTWTDCPACNGTGKQGRKAGEDDWEGDAFADPCWVCFETGRLPKMEGAT